jgi:hypothetical protein
MTSHIFSRETQSDRCYPVLHLLKSEFNSCYLDDGTMADCREVVLRDFRTIIEFLTIFIALNRLQLLTMERVQHIASFVDKWNLPIFQLFSITTSKPETTFLTTGLKKWNKSC